MVLKEIKSTKKIMGMTESGEKVALGVPIPKAIAGYNKLIRIK